MLEPDPRVSVVIPFHNGAPFLDETIASVLAQTWSDFELLLCDDGSIDGSTDTAKEWATRHPEQIRYLEHPGHDNRGASPTRNMGLAAARGDLVALLDADDVWRPTKLADQIAIMDAHPEVGMVCGAARYWASWNGGQDEVVTSGHAQNRVVHPPEASLAVYPLGSAPAPCPSDLLLRRAAVEAIGGFEERFIGARQLYEDQAFLSKVYLTWPVFFSSSLWLDYRLHEDSCVASVNREGLYDEVRLDFLDWFQTYLRDRAETPRAVRLAVARALLPYRHPYFHRLGRVVKRAIRRP
jgi:glycosyltransferase involved in cell wall biosynthesis